MQHPDKSEYADFYAGYVSLVPEDDVVAAIEDQTTKTQKLLSALDDTGAAYRYAEGKWSIKEVLGHLTDAERIFAVRALCISRGETQPLPGFDENQYVREASFDIWKLGDLVETYALVRRATILLFRNISEEAWTRRGTASDNPVTVRALARIILGHERHHVKTLQERYGL
ncbi:MAG TPA: DinB family protein [Thermoanaerobaculia bacterium]|nr:DinB family protein [Thermoanaerobaculia bacterium]